MTEKLFPTAVVGSYPQPDWLVDHEMLSKGVPRIRMKEMWRVAEPWLEQAQDDATVIAISDMERAGIDIVTDGEMRRESYSNRFATALEGIDIERPGEVLTGPFTMGKQAIDEYYKDDEALAMDMAAAVNQEAHDLVRAGADEIQLDEPWVRSDPAGARRYAVKAINRALQGITVPTVIHLCFGYAVVVPGDEKPSNYAFLGELADTTATTISIEAAQPKVDLGVLVDLAPKNVMLGVLDLLDMIVETPELVAERIRRGLKHLAPERLIAAPDCGMKYLPRAVAFGKLKAMSEGASIVRREMS